MRWMPVVVLALLFGGVATGTAAGSGPSAKSALKRTSPQGANALTATPTSNVLTTSPNPSLFQQAVLFRDTVIGSTLVDSGTVFFYVDGVKVDSSAVGLDGIASVSYAGMTAGTHSVFAFYGGTSVFDTSTSNGVSQTVNQATPTVTLQSNLDPSVFGQNVTFTAHVDGSTQTPTGSVTFYDGAVSLGSSALSGDSAKISSSSLAVGSHTIKAVYSGDTNFKIDSTSITQTVNQATPTVTLASSLNPSTFGQNVTFTAHVTSTSGTPTGSVTFFDGTTSLGTVALTGDSARVSTSTLTTGSHTIKAVYGGDSNFKSDSTSIAQTVNQAAPTVTLASSLNPSTFGQNVTFTAHVTSTSGTPTGSVSFFDGTTSLGTISLTGDSARVSTSTLTAGSHTIKAVYGGDTNFKIDSTSITQTVNQATPTVTLASSLNPSTFGQNVTFTAHVTSTSGTPTGSVTFFDGTTSLGTVALTGDSARVSTSTLTTGSHTIKAVYGGNSNFKSDSTSITQTVNQAAPTVTLASNVNPSTFGQNVTFTAHVTSTSGTPTGSVSFFDGTTSLGTISLTGDSARVSTSALTSGSHTIKAVYSGDSNFKIDSTSITQTVNQAAPAVTLASSANPSTFGQNVTFTARVTSTSGTPTGSVSFFDGISSLGTVALTGDSARVSTSTLTAGSHTIKAVYGGDSNFRSDSTSITQTVNQSSVVMSLASSLNPSTFGQNVTFTAHVTSTSGTPTGSVSFFDGTTSLGTVALTGDSARVSSSTLTAGSHTIKAVYGGDSNFGKDSTSITQTVNKAAPAVSLASGLNPSTFGQSVTFTAHVTSTSGTPTGSVSFFDGATSLGTIALTGDSARVSTSTLTAGSHTIKAVYGGDPNFKSDSASIAQTVNLASPTVTLASSPNPSTLGQTVRFTAHVTSSSGSPTGTVSFFDGATSLGTVSLIGDSASVSTAALTVGSHSMKAVYSGDSNFKSDSSSITQTVNQATATVALASSVNPSTFGQNVTFTAHVTSTSGTPTGSVSFFDGTTSLGTASLSGDSATASTSALVVGSHTIKAVYSGDTNFKSDSTSVTQTVNQASTTVALASSLNPSTFGQSVTFTAHVTSSSGSPTGSVAFFDGATSLGTASLVGDSASVSTSALTGGSHTIKAVYGGDSNFGRDSMTITQTVNLAPPTVTLASSLNPSIYGQSVTFTAHVTSTSGTPTGSVSFFDGTTSLGTVALAGDSARVSTSALTGGSHTIKAVYGGDLNFRSDSTSIIQTVNQAAATVTLASSLNPSIYGQNVTFTAHVTSASGVPTGSVSFFDGAASIGTTSLVGDSARLSTSTLLAGSHTIKAVYNGDINFRRDSTTVTQNVNQAGPTLALTSSANPSLFGQSVTFTAYVTSSSGTPTGSVSFFDGASLLGSFTLVGDSARVSTSSLATGSHTIKAVYSGDANFRKDSTTITQNVNQSGALVTLTSSLNPSILGQNVTFTAHVTSSSTPPTGSVFFYDGASLLGSFALVGDSARVSTSTLSTGSHTIKAVYSGDANYQADSATVTQVVNQASAVVSLSSSLNPSTYGQNVAFTARVTSTLATPTGTVSFFDGATPLGIVALAGDSALLSTSALIGGSHAIKAVYSGDGNFRSDSASVTQTVNPAVPVVSLSSSLNPSTYGQSVTFTAHVTSSSGTPGGSVSFFDGTTSLGTAPLAGDSALVATSALIGGSHTMKAVYSGDVNFRTDSTSITQTVNQAAATVVLASSLNPSTYGQSVTFTAHVTSTSGVPGGSVSFFDGATSLGTVSLVGDSARVSTSSLAAGTHTVKAVYSGDVNFRSDSSSITQTVNKSGPVISLVSSSNPSTFGQNVTFTARVTSSSTTPTGSVSFFDGATSLGTVFLVGDSAFLSTSALVAGSHTIKAVYGGDANFLSDSTTLVQTVNQSGSGVTLTSSANPSVFEQSVTFKAKVSHSTTMPTGSVAFYDGAALLGNVALTADSAGISTAALTVGSHTIKAVYSGDANYQTDSTTIVQTVNQAVPVMALRSSLNPSTFEQSVTFTATVTNSSHTPTGTVSFFDGLTLLGTAGLTGDSAQLSTAALTAGSHTIKALYSGDGNFTSDSTTIVQTVNRAVPVMALRSSLNPSTFEQSVTFTATVTNSSHTPTGNVSFYDGINLLGTVALTGDSAQLSTAALTAGIHSVKAVYGGDANFLSDSASISQTVNQALPAMALRSSLNPSTFGQNVTFTAVVSGASNTPTGSVAFYDGTISLGSAPLVGDSATLGTSTLAAGSHTIKAVYGGDSNFLTDSTTLVQTVNQSGAGVTLTSSLNPSVFEQSVTFQAKVSHSAIMPTGNVAFYDGLVLLSDVGLSGDSASVSTAALSAGIHTIKAVYSGDANYKSDSTTITQTVNKALPVMALRSSQNPSNLDQSVTFTATITSSPNTPTGSVSFYDGATLLGTSPLTGDSAQTSTSTLTGGSHTIKAVYGGDANFQADSATLTQAVNQLSAGMSLTSSLNPSVFEQSVTFKAKISHQSTLPTGTVAFYDGSISLGIVPLHLDSAEVSTAALAAGSHTIKAVYSGDGNFQPDSTTLVQTVNQAVPVMTLRSSLNPSTFEQSVTFTALVTNSSHTPTGTIAFFDGATALGTVGLTGDSAQLTTAALTGGSHVIKSVYSGDADFTRDSTTLTQTVNRLALGVTLSATPDTSQFGQPVLLKAKIAHLATLPTGTVTFYDTTFSLGTVAVAGDSATLSTSALPTGVHTLKAVYSGDINFRNDSSSITQTVNKTSVTMTLVSSQNPSLFGQSVTFKSHVDNPAATPTGNVAFYDGATLLGSSALVGDSAQFSTAGLSTGTHTIKAVYGGDINYIPDSLSMIQGVNRTGVSIALTSSLNPSTYGQTVVLKTKVDNPTLQPTGTVAYYDGISLLGIVALIGDSAQLTLPALTAGTHPMKAVYSGDANYSADSASLSQVVNKAGVTFTVSSLPNPSTYTQTVTIKVKVDNVFSTPTGTVSLYDGTTLISSSSLIGDSVQATDATLASGSHTIKAVYSGDVNFRADSTSYTQIVNKAGGTLALTSSLNPSTFGQNVTFKLKVDFPTAQPTGTVFFYDGTTLLGTPVLIGDSAQVSTSSLVAGSHTIKAVYGGDANFKSDSTTLVQTINQSTVIITLTSNPNPSSFGQSVTIKAKVDNAVRTPTGTVTLYDGAVSLGTLVLVGDSVQVSTSSLAAGSHTIKAVYNGDSTFKSDSASITQTVNQAGVTVTLTSSLNPSAYGQPVVFKAKVDNPALTPTGNVTFYDGTTSFATVALAGDSAMATTSTLGAGTHAIKAVYAGNANYRSDSASITQTVSKTGVTMTFASSPNPSTYGQGVRMVAKVTPASGNPTGQVRFYDGATFLAAAGLVADSAQIGVSSLAAGSHTIKAVYTGDANFLPDSATGVQTVGKRSITAVIFSSPNPSVFGQNVTFRDSAVETVPDGGTVQFMDGTTAIGSPATFNARGVATLTYAGLLPGTHTVTAIYSGSSNFTSDTSNAVLQVVNRLPSSGILTASTTHVSFGQSVTFRDSIASSVHDGGTVQFRDGLTDMGAPVSVDSTGVAVFVSPGFTNGGHAISARFSGTASVAPNTSNFIDLNVSDTSMYRTFVPESIALSRDYLGRLGKLVPRKAVEVYFVFSARSFVLGANGMHVEFTSQIDTSKLFYTVPPSTRIRAGTLLNKWDFVFNQEVPVGDTVRIYGYGKGARYQRITNYYWRKGPDRFGLPIRNPSIDVNVLRTAMPNALTGVSEAFATGGFFATNGLRVGQERRDSAAYYGWLQAANYLDVLKSLRVDTMLQRGVPRGLDYYTTLPSRPIVRQQKNIPPTRQQNRLLADMIALKFNIVASELGMTPPGLGELVYNDGTANPLNGRMIKRIAQIADSVMMGVYTPSVRAKIFADPQVFTNLATTIESINVAFQGRIDTVKFADTLRFTPVRSVYNVPYIYPNPGVTPDRITPMNLPIAIVPEVYRLYQNYPNPFNPTTTIGFNISIPSYVTLKVYDLLGQEVATLINHEAMEDGFQEVPFNAGSLASGVYFYRITVEQLTEDMLRKPGEYYTTTKKMILMR